MVNKARAYVTATPVHLARNSAWLGKLLGGGDVPKSNFRVSIPSKREHTMPAPQSKFMSGEDKCIEYNVRGLTHFLNSAPFEMQSMVLSSSSSLQDL